MAPRIAISIAVLVTIICTLNNLGPANAVDHTVFKTCTQSSFCRRCRALQPGTSTFNVIASTEPVTVDASTVRVDLTNTANGVQFVLTVQALEANTFRVQIDEKTPLFERYRVEDALKGSPVAVALQLASNDGTKLTLTAGTNRVEITKVPLQLDFYENNVLTVTANGRGLMRFEHYRTKPSTGSVPGNSIEEQDPGSWEEEFNGFVDNKPHGPEAIAMDFGFPQAAVLMGIPAHANSLALKSTVGTEPYRLYNLDVAEHEVDSTMALYGAVPVIYGHGATRTAGVFWHNAAETWVDIYNATSASAPLAANFMTESGILDAFILLGPRPLDTFGQYTRLTGVAPLPQLYTLAYHQCRWNYDNATDVKEVAARFEANDIPLDTMWLDIEYTDAKKYFTWHPTAFADPMEMITNLSASGRHLHVIVDIHLMYDTTYPVHMDCVAQNLYTKTDAGVDYVGDCWPGLSGYPDVFTSAARDYLADRYANHFPNTTENIMIWNDMNEPSTFNGPEKTMPKTNIHSKLWEHRHVHNQFGHQQLRSTHQGLLARGKNIVRPFILTRSHFAGSQRYAMIWTGDNTADWRYLQVSLKMCLAEAVAGFSFCGADVGGFFGNPDDELYARWYQAAAWTPFFRSHANLDTPRREPWLYTAATMARIRAAVKRRYAWMPFWYTLFYEHERNGLPVMRPLLAEFPSETGAFAIDHQFMLGSALLVHPVMAAAQTVARVYLPEATWYDIDDYARHEGAAAIVELPVDMDKVYVFQRGGSIVPQKRTERKATEYMKNDPYTVVVALNGTGHAQGTLYADDERSFEYRSGKYVHAVLRYADGWLNSSRMDATAAWDTALVVERVVIAGVNGTLKSVQVMVMGVENATAIEVQQVGNTFVVQGLVLKVNEEWQLRFNGAGMRIVSQMVFWPVVALGALWAFLVSG